MHAATAGPRPHPFREWLVAGGLAAVAFAVFARSLSGEFVNYDDTYYVTRNPHIFGGLNLPGVRWAFTTFYNSNWHPLTWLSLQLDVSLFPPGPWGFHLTNVLLHAANATLAFLALRALTGACWRSAAAALLFAVHPLRVESVAWVSERKDVLSIFFGLLTLWAYPSYARAPSVRRYLAVASLFALSLLAKPTLVTLPFLLLVLDWWPLGRWQHGAAWRLVREKVPLLALAAASCVVTIRAQSEGTVESLAEFPPSVRAANATTAYMAYLSKTVWPVNLSPFYPYATGYTEGGSRVVMETAACSLLLAALTAVAVVLRRRAPYVLAGWLWYLGTLVPVIGLVQVGGQAYADRYTYFPQLGLLVGACWAAADLARPLAVAAGVAAVAIALAAVCWDQQAIWHDSLALWTKALEVFPGNPTFLMNLGEALEEHGRLAEAERCYRQSLQTVPDSAVLHTHLGILLSREGKDEAAEPELERACRLAPRSASAHTFWGHVLFRLGKLEEAVKRYDEAVGLAPGDARVFCDLGLAETARGNLDRAANCYRTALELQPDLPEAHLRLGGILIRQGHEEPGLRELRAALDLAARAGTDSPARRNAGAAAREILLAAGRPDLAAEIEDAEPSPARPGPPGR